MLQSSDDASDAKFLAYIKENGLGWWHWLGDSWLLVDKSLQLTADNVRDKLNEIYGCHNMVILIRGDGTDTWAGFGPKAEERGFFPWIRTNWKRPS